MKITQKPSLHASWIDPFAKEIVERLQRAGFTSYLVGGCVRDLVLGLKPKDWDITTNAIPEEIQKLFELESTLKATKGVKHTAFAKSTLGGEL